MVADVEAYADLLAARVRAAEAKREAQDAWLKVGRTEIATLTEELMVMSKTWPHDDEGMVRREVRAKLTNMVNTLIANMPEGRVLV